MPSPKQSLKIMRIKQPSWIQYQMVLAYMELSLHMERWRFHAFEMKMHYWNEYIRPNQCLHKTKAVWYRIYLFYGKHEVVIRNFNTTIQKTADNVEYGENCVQRYWWNEKRFDCVLIYASKCSYSLHRTLSDNGKCY